MGAECGALFRVLSCLESYCYVWWALSLALRSPRWERLGCYAFRCTVNLRYNESICSQSRCHQNEFAVVQNT